jgi:TonB family protein
MSTAPLIADSYPMPEPFHAASPNAIFMAGDVPHGANEKLRFGNAFSVSALTHVGVFLLGVFIYANLPAPTPRANPAMDLPREIVWIATEGPGGGGGGGGNRMPDPPRKAELPGKEKITVPVTKPPKLENPEPPKDIPEPVQQMNIPAVTASAGVQELPGALTGLPSSASLGSGSGGGAGTGTGTGIGPGSGSGLGDGTGGGFGGGAYRPGNGVMPPKLLREVKPSYTAEAMRAKIQGVVTLEAVVNPDGSVGSVQVVRSLDQTFGLDEEAKRTVRKWLFQPGTRLGQPVPVLVEIEMTFTLR